MRGDLLAEQAVGVGERRVARRAVAAVRLEGGDAGALPRPADAAGGEDDQRERHGEEEDGDERRAAITTHHAVLRAPACRSASTASSTIASTAAFRPKNSAATMPIAPKPA